METQDNGFLKEIDGVRKEKERLTAAKLQRRSHWKEKELAWENRSIVSASTLQELISLIFWLSLPMICMSVALFSSFPSHTTSAKLPFPRDWWIIWSILGPHFLSFSMSWHSLSLVPVLVSQSYDPIIVPQTVSSSQPGLSSGYRRFPLPSPL